MTANEILNALSLLLIFALIIRTARQAPEQAPPTTDLRVARLNEMDDS